MNLLIGQLRSLYTSLRATDATMSPVLLIYQHSSPSEVVCKIVEPGIHSAFISPVLSVPGEASQYAARNIGMKERAAMLERLSLESNALGHWLGSIGGRR